MLTVAARRAPHSGLTPALFDKVPAERRAEAFEMHQEGWEIKLGDLARYASAE
jgi:hypothetical protein